jgi:DNA mismatch repair protein MutS2
MIIGPKTLEYLGWATIVERLVSLAKTSVGKRRAAATAPLPALPEVERELARVAELQTLMETAPLPDFAGISELSEVLYRAEKEGTLAPAELLAVGDCIQGIARVHAFVTSHRRHLEANAFVLLRLHDLRTLSGRISVTIDRDGTIRDEASPALRELRERAAEVHRTIKARLEETLKSRLAEEALQEKYYTLREDRYVLPVRSERKHAVEGIVHGVSQSGATVFVEPEFLIGLNNRLKLAQEDVHREELALLKDLTTEVAQNSHLIAESIEMAGVFDHACARARLAQQFRAARPQLGCEMRLELMGARSPLLLAQNREVVPSHLVLGKGSRILVLSGPNAGGKSVCLKTCGLCVLMAASGLLVPAGADSYLPLLEGLHALPGDLEDVGEQLSTFTGHLQELNRILGVAREGHLVLVDEITVGTEPEQGAALGAAYLLQLAQIGAMAVVATHYERLKALALVDERFQNASMGMDWDTLTPDYKLTLGQPGSSRTLEIARRCEVPEAVVLKAEELLQGKQGSLLEMAIRSLSEREAELARVSKEYAEKTAVAELLRRKRTVALEQLERHARRLVSRRVAAGVEQVDQALSLVAGLEAQMQKKKPDHETLAASRKTLREIQERLKEKASEAADQEVLQALKQEVLAGPIKAGSEVLVKKFRRKALVAEVHEREGTATLKMGPMRMRLPFAELVPLAGRGEGEKAPAVVRRPETESAPQRLDLRGAYAEDGVERVSKALDQASLAPGGPLVIVHGFGTGRLKAAVRDYLKSSSYPISFRPGKKEEGGDGVTVVEFVGSYTESR